MGRLGSLRGSGHISCEAGKFPCSYSIDVFEQRQMKFGRGRIVADDAPLFDAVGKMLTLTLENGAEMQILIDQLSIGSGEASVNSSGPIPGF